MKGGNEATIQASHGCKPVGVSEANVKWKAVMEFASANEITRSPERRKNAAKCAFQIDEGENLLRM